MNAYNFGGYLVFRGVAPYIDGRLELYGEDFVAHYYAIEDFLPLLDAYGARWTIFEPKKPGASPCSTCRPPGGAPMPERERSFTFARRDRQGLAPSCASRSWHAWVTSSGSVVAHIQVSRRNLMSKQSR